MIENIIVTVEIVDGEKGVFTRQVRMTGEFFEEHGERMTLPAIKKVRAQVRRDWKAA